MKTHCTKKHGLLVILAALSLPTLASRADTPDDLRAAIQKLGDAPNYSWTTANQSGFGKQESDGKTEKNGFTIFNVNAINSAYPAVMQGERAVVKTDNGWQSMFDLQKASDDAGGFSLEGFVLLQVQGYKPPAAQLSEILPRLGNISKTDTGFTAELPAAYAKDLLTVRFPSGAGGVSTQPAKPDDFRPMMPLIQLMTVKNPRGTLVITVKDGAVSQFEMRLTGMISFNDQDRPTERTITTRIKDVGTTKVSVPDEAKTKFERSAPTTAGK